ncbi:MAG: hypothetical protein AB1898_05040 [Acidobacteriota bacterium]
MKRVLVLALLLALSPPAPVGSFRGPLQEGGLRPGSFVDRTQQVWPFDRSTPSTARRLFALAQEKTIHTFNPAEIEVLMNPDVDIVYHTLAHFPIPGDPSNLYDQVYLNHIRQAKKDLEVASTKLDQEAVELGRVYREHRRLRFLNLALFMADDLSSFKQALSSIDYYRVESEVPDNSSGPESAAQARKRPEILIFQNARRLIPLFSNRFPEEVERKFVRDFAEAMEDEQIQFYRSYRESRSELDQQDFDRFQRMWRGQGYAVVRPWAARSGVNVFKIYLSPVFRNNGRGVPVNQAQSVLFYVVAPLPETDEHARQSLFVVLHETSHRVTDSVLEEASGSAEVAGELRENAVFFANHLYLKNRFPDLHTAYLRFFLNAPASTPARAAELERMFLKTYPVPPPLQEALRRTVKNLS